MKTRALLAFCVGFVLAAFAPSAVAQPETQIKEAMDLYGRGRDGEALEKLKGVLATDPTSEDVWAAIRDIDFRDWASAMIKGQEHATVIQAIMDLGVPAKRGQAADADAIKGLVAKLEADAWNERQAALNTLRADHGEYAIPHLAQRFNSADTMKRATYMEWTRRMGLQAVMPLIQITKSDDGQVARNAVTILGQLGDRRALPYLAFHAMAEDQAMRDAAQRALSDMGSGGTDARNAALQLAEAYYRRDADVVAANPGSNAVWRFVGGEAVAYEVPRDVYHLKLAEELLFDTLARYPSDRDARILLTSVLLAEDAAGESEEGSALSQASVMAAVEDMDILDAALGKALADNRPAVAKGAIELIAERLGAGSGDRGVPHSLSQALDAQAKRVRFAAALAHAENGFTDGRVNAILVEAVSQTSIRTVLVIDDQPDTRNRIVSDLNARGYFAYGAPTGAMGFARVREYPIEDAVIIRYDLADRTAAEVVRMLKADERTADRPIAILAREDQMEGARAALEDKVQLFISAPPAVEAYEPELKTALGDLDEARAAATNLAARAAQALAHGNASTDAVPALVSVLKSDDSVRIPAMMALGKIGDGQASMPLLEVFSDASASSEVRGAAAVALAKVARNTGSLAQEAREAIAEAIKGDGEPAFWNSLGRALGIAPISAETRLELQSALRERIKVDLVE